MKKFFIIPGFSKAGTTYLYNQLISEKHIFNIPFSKEVGAFRASVSLDSYLKNFMSIDEEKIFIDASPEYAEPWHSAFENIKQCLATESVLVCFCLRSPVERAFSHYLHDLITHFHRFSYAGSRFEDPRTLARYLFRLSPQIKKAQKIFGQDNVVGIELAHMQAHFPQKLVEYLGLTSNWRPNLHADKFSGGWVPSIHYGGPYGTISSINGLLYRIPANTLVVCNGPYSDYLENVDETSARRLLQSASQWSYFVDKHQISNATKESERDYEEACALLGVSSSLKTDRFIHVSRHPELTPEITTKLEHINEQIIQPLPIASRKGGNYKITGNLILDQTLIERAYANIQSAAATELAECIDEMVEVIIAFSNTHGWERDKVHYALGLAISIANKKRILEILYSPASTLVNSKELTSKLDYYRQLFNDEDLHEIASAITE